MKAWRRWFLVVLAVLLLAVVNIQAEAKFTIEDEKKLGKEFYEKLEKSGALVTELCITRYVDAVGKKIVGDGSESPFTFRFSVIKSSAINAFATPGGYVYVNHGLITIMENESQLAAVLAHEIAHVQARHIAQIIEKSTKVNIATLAAVLAGAFLGGSGDLGPAVMTFSLAAATTMNLKYSREHEEEADRLGFVSLKKAGYDTHATVDLLRIMRRYDFYSNAIPSYFLTHPETETRIQYLDAMLNTTEPPGGKTSIVGGLKRVQTILFVRSEEPSSNLKRFQENLKKNPGDMDDLYGLALIQDKLGAAAEARATFQLALEKAPGDVEIMRDLGASYFRSGQLEQAIAYLARAYVNNTDDEETIHYLGRSYLAAGQYKPALELFRRALQKNSDDPDLHYHLGLAYGKTNDAGESHYHFGYHFKKKNKEESALFHFQEARKYFPGTSERAQEIAKEIETIKEGKRRPPPAPQAPDGRNRGRFPP